MLCLYDSIPPIIRSSLIEKVNMGSLTKTCTDLSAPCARESKISQAQTSSLNGDTTQHCLAPYTIDLCTHNSDSLQSVHSRKPSAGILRNLQLEVM